MQAVVFRVSFAAWILRSVRQDVSERFLGSVVSHHNDDRLLTQPVRLEFTDDVPISLSA